MKREFSEKPKFKIKPTPYHIEDRMDHYNPHHKDELGEEELEEIHKTHLGDFDDFSFWLVDGYLIRNTIDEDYVSGGNPSRYRYIPEDEIWIEYTTVEEEIVPVLLHEFVECKLMKEDKLSYDDAHDIACLYEKNCRDTYEFSGDFIEDLEDEVDKAKKA